MRTDIKFISYVSSKTYKMIVGVKRYFPQKCLLLEKGRKHHWHSAGTLAILINVVVDNTSHAQGLNSHTCIHKPLRPLGWASLIYTHFSAVYEIKKGLSLTPFVDGLTRTSVYATFPTFSAPKLTLNFHLFINHLHLSTIFFKLDCLQDYIS